MSARDENLARELTGLIELFFEYTAKREVPALRGLRRKPPEEFMLAVGVYRRYRGNSLMQRSGLAVPWQPPLADVERDDRARLEEVKLTVKYRMLSLNTFERTTVLPGEENLVSWVREGNKTRFTVPHPHLYEMSALGETDRKYRFDQFARLELVGDLKWDDVEALRTIDYPYADSMDYELPRRHYDRNRRRVLPPEQLFEKEPQNRKEEWREEQTKLFHDQLWEFATYSPHQGDYYRKWKDPRPKDARHRVLRYANMSSAYFDYNFGETILEKGKSYVHIEFNRNAVVSQIVEKRRGNRRAISLEHVFKRGPVRGEVTIPPGASVQATFFYAIDGEAKVRRRTKASARASMMVGDRYIVDYKSQVKAVYGQDVALRSDQEWLNAWVRHYFPDTANIVKTGASRENLNIPRDRLFLNALRDHARTARGPLKAVYGDLVRHYESNEDLQVFTQGMPTTDDYRLIGIRLTGDKGLLVYEFNVAEGIVTVSEWSAWWDGLLISDFASRVYERTKHVIPFAMVVVWGGTIVGGLGALGGLGAAGQWALHTAVSTEAVKQGTKVVRKELIKRVRPQLMSMATDAVMGLIPRDDDLRFTFFHGFVRGFGYTTLDHYISGVDERFERAVKHLFNRVTRPYRWYKMYQNVRGALDRLERVIEDVEQRFDEAQGKILRDVLTQSTEHLGRGIVLALVSALFLDYDSVSWMGGAPNRKRDWEKSRAGYAASTSSVALPALLAQADALAPELEEDADPAATAYPAEAFPRAGKPLPHDKAMADRLVANAKKFLAADDVLDAVMEGLLDEAGFADYKKLRKHFDFWEFLTSGFGYVRRKYPGKVGDEVFSLGEAVGTFFGTIFLGRTVAPKGSKLDTLKKVPLIGKSSKKALDDGFFRTLWRLLVYPFARIAAAIKGIPKLADSALGKLLGDGELFRLDPDETSLARLVRLLVDNDRLFTDMMRELAADALLPAALRELDQRVGGEAFPSLAALAGEGDPGWSREACLFLMLSHARAATGEMAKAIQLLDDPAPFGGNLRVMEVFEILGMEPGLGDTLSKSMELLVRPVR